MPSTRLRYDPVAITLHWLIGLAILLMLAMGQLFDRVPDAFKPLAYNTHKSIGISILALSIFRLVWRLLNPPPALPETIPALQRILAHLGHWALYALMLGLPLSGWLMVSAMQKYPISFFGLGTAPFLPMPALANPEAAAKQLAEMHELLANGCIALLALHIGAALQHQFFRKDGLLWRILPKRR